MDKAQKKALLQTEIQHVDITKINATPVIDAMRGMSFASRETARATDIFVKMVNDADCSNILTLAGSTSAGGCMQAYVDLVRHNMIDAVVSTGASVVDMDFFEALGYKHYQGSPFEDDKRLRSLYIDRIYDTYIDEEELQNCDATVKEIADSIEPRPYSSREFIAEMGKWLAVHSKKKDSLIQVCYEKGVPIFVPAFSDCSAGFGLVLHQKERIQQGKPYVTIDSVADFRELTDIKIAANVTGLLMIGGGSPKNFAQDTVVCAECQGIDVPLHKYAVQITVADVRDGACSSSTLKEASSWGKVDTIWEQMVYAEATTVLPLLASYAYHNAQWQLRKSRNFNQIFVKK
ncbi:deoxyhypusine synthase-like protein [Bacteroidia bacterium]|nr:deoxyhypusine synthase-like protein [Bacteroidia bacterium]